MHGLLSETLDGDAHTQRLYQLELRVGTEYARNRLEQERAKAASVMSRQGKHVHLENLYSLPTLIRLCFQAAGLYGRGQRNSRSIRVTDNRFILPYLPQAFEGFRLLHLSDLHVDMDDANLEGVRERVRGLDYDLCVITGDYRKETWGDINPALAGMQRLRGDLSGEVLAILGNHDSIMMVPELEAMGYRMLMNENHCVERSGERLWIAGVDDPHQYQADDIPAALANVPTEETSLLLSHTPEIYAEAAHAGLDMYLCGHTHGGQICLPGGYPLTLDARCPRFLGKGHWHYDGMQGYTSVGAGTSIINIRLNCPPEITVHTLTRGPR